MKSATIIGSGFSSIAAATSLAANGIKATVIEKNQEIGGRARKFERDGFTFDMGPSWYWMPDVFENYFNTFNKKPSDYYDLVRLEPSYRVFFKDEHVDIPSSFTELCQLFEEREPGAGEKLISFLKDAAIKYDAGINDLVHKPGHSILEFAQWKVMKGLFQLDLLTDFHSFARRYFSDDKLLSIVEFPILFLGAMPQDTPALYSLMNYADMKLGTWYPMGGMHKVIEAMESLAKEHGVEFRTNEPVQKIFQNGTMNTVTSKETISSDFVVGGADYHHIETSLLEEKDRQYSEQYWESRTMAPSCLLYYVGVNKNVEGLQHHNLFFDTPFDLHAQEIYKTKKWPSDPLFYVCCPSKTDKSVAPDGKENLFILIPIAPGLNHDTQETREQYFKEVIARIEKHTKHSFQDQILFHQSYSVSEFKSDYNSFKGNAYGLANTLRQTAFLKPKLRHKKLKNLYYTGQLTTPGPGMPPSLISGQVVANEILKNL
ncbi:MAG: phytoene desaturase family protein [Salibacteraceae bacterium]